MNKKLLVILGVAMGGLIVVVLGIAVWVLADKVGNLEKNEDDVSQGNQNENNNNQNDKSDTEDNETISIVVDSVSDEVVVGNNDCVYNHTYPQLTSNIELEYIDEINEDLQQFSAHSVDVSTCETGFVKMNPTAPYFSQDLSFESSNISNDVFCFVFDISYYSNGAAHPGFEKDSVCYDLRNSEEIEDLGDFLEGDYREPIVDYYETQIPIDMNYPEFWNEDFVSPDNAFDLAKFYIEDGDLVLYWQPYEIGSGAMGAIEVVVPLSELAGLYSDDSVLARF